MSWRWASESLRAVPQICLPYPGLPLSLTHRFAYARQFTLHTTDCRVTPWGATFSPHNASLQVDALLLLRVFLMK
jgi:hypothetical protein